MSYGIGAMLAALAPTLLGQGDGGSTFVVGAAGSLAGIVVMALVQAWRGRSLRQVEQATVAKLREETGKTIDDRWKAIAERVDEENDELRQAVTDLKAQIRDCHTEIRTLRARIDELEADRPAS